MFTVQPPYRRSESVNYDRNFHGSDPFASDYGAPKTGNHLKLIRTNTTDGSGCRCGEKVSANPTMGTNEVYRSKLRPATLPTGFNGGNVIEVIRSSTYERQCYMDQIRRYFPNPPSAPGFFTCNQNLPASFPVRSNSPIIQHCSPTSEREGYSAGLPTSFRDGDRGNSPHFIRPNSPSPERHRNYLSQKCRSYSVDDMRRHWNPYHYSKGPVDQKENDQAHECSMMEVSNRSKVCDNYPFTTMPYSCSENLFFQPKITDHGGLEKPPTSCRSTSVPQRDCDPNESAYTATYIYQPSVKCRTSFHDSHRSCGNYEVFYPHMNKSRGQRPRTNWTDDAEIYPNLKPRSQNRTTVKKRESESSFNVSTKSKTNRVVAKRKPSNKLKRDSVQTYTSAPAVTKKVAKYPEHANEVSREMSISGSIEVRRKGTLSTDVMSFTRTMSFGPITNVDIPNTPETDWTIYGASSAHAASLQVAANVCVETPIDKVCAIEVDYLEEFVVSSISSSSSHYSWGVTGSVGGMDVPRLSQPPTKLKPTEIRFEDPSTSDRISSWSKRSYNLTSQVSGGSIDTPKSTTLSSNRNVSKVTLVRMPVPPTIASTRTSTPTRSPTQSVPNDVSIVIQREIPGNRGYSDEQSMNRYPGMPNTDMDRTHGSTVPRLKHPSPSGRPLLAEDWDPMRKLISTDSKPAIRKPPTPSRSNISSPGLKQELPVTEAKSQSIPQSPIPLTSVQPQPVDVSHETSSSVRVLYRQVSHHKSMESPNPVVANPQSPHTQDKLQEKPSQEIPPLIYYPSLNSVPSSSPTQGSTSELSTGTRQSSPKSLKWTKINGLPNPQADSLKDSITDPGRKTSGVTTPITAALRRSTSMPSNSKKDTITSSSEPSVNVFETVTQPEAVMKTKRVNDNSVERERRFSSSPTERSENTPELMMKKSVSRKYMRYEKSSSIIHTGVPTANIGHTTGSSFPYPTTGEMTAKPTSRVKDETRSQFDGRFDDPKDILTQSHRHESRKYPAPSSTTASSGRQRSKERNEESSVDDTTTTEELSKSSIHVHTNEKDSINHVQAKKRKSNVKDKTKKTRVIPEISTRESQRSPRNHSDFSDVSSFRLRLSRSSPTQGDRVEPKKAASSDCSLASACCPKWSRNNSPRDNPSKKSNTSTERSIEWQPKNEKTTRLTATQHWHQAHDLSTTPPLSPTSSRRRLSSIAQSLELAALVAEKTARESRHMSKTRETGRNPLPVESKPDASSGGWRQRPSGIRDHSIDSNESHALNTHDLVTSSSLVTSRKDYGEEESEEVMTGKENGKDDDEDEEDTDEEGGSEDEWMLQTTVTTRTTTRTRRVVKKAISVVDEEPNVIAGLDESLLSSKLSIEPGVSPVATQQPVTSNVPDRTNDNTLQGPSPDFSSLSVSSESNRNSPYVSVVVELSRYSSQCDPPIEHSTSLKQNGSGHTSIKVLNTSTGNDFSTDIFASSNTPEVHLENGNWTQAQNVSEVNSLRIRPQSKTQSFPHTSIASSLSPPTRIQSVNPGSFIGASRSIHFSTSSETLTSDRDYTGPHLSNSDGPIELDISQPHTPYGEHVTPSVGNDSEFILKSDIMSSNLNELSVSATAPMEVDIDMQCRDQCIALIPVSNTTQPNTSSVSPTTRMSVRTCPNHPRSHCSSNLQQELPSDATFSVKENKQLLQPRKIHSVHLTSTPMSLTDLAMGENMSRSKVSSIPKDTTLVTHSSTGTGLTLLQPTEPPTTTTTIQETDCTCDSCCCFEHDLVIITDNACTCAYPHGLDGKINSTLPEPTPGGAFSNQPQSAYLSQRLHQQIALSRASVIISTSTVTNTPGTIDGRRGNTMETNDDVIYDRSGSNVQKLHSSTEESLMLATPTVSLNVESDELTTGDLFLASVRLERRISAETTETVNEESVDEMCWESISHKRGGAERKREPGKDQCFSRPSSSTDLMSQFSGESNMTLNAFDEGYNWNNISGSCINESRVEHDLNLTDYSDDHECYLLPFVVSDTVPTQELQDKPVVPQPYDIYPERRGTSRSTIRSVSRTNYAELRRDASRELSHLSGRSISKFRVRDRDFSSVRSTSRMNDSIWNRSTENERNLKSRESIFSEYRNSSNRTNVRYQTGYEDSAYSHKFNNSTTFTTATNTTTASGTLHFDKQAIFTKSYPPMEQADFSSQLQTASDWKTSSQAPRDKLTDVWGDLETRAPITTDQTGLTSRHTHYNPNRHGTVREIVYSSNKITPVAQNILSTIRHTVHWIMQDLVALEKHLLDRDFTACEAISEHLATLPPLFVGLLDHLHYTPVEADLVHLTVGLSALVDQIVTDPVTILFHLLELGYRLNHLARMFGEDLLPDRLPRLIHAIQAKLHRMKIGYVSRQYFHVPEVADALLTPYTKSRQFLRLEEDCGGQINLLHPEDPRAVYCPPGYRTIEVVFEEKSGRPELFQRRMNYIIDPKRPRIRLVATVVRQINGQELSMSAEVAKELLHCSIRPRYRDVRAVLQSAGSRTIGMW